MVRYFSVVIILYFTVQNLLKESQQMQDTKDRQISDMKNLLEETNTTKRQEFEKKVQSIGIAHSVIVI